MVETVETTKENSKLKKTKLVQFRPQRLPPVRIGENLTREQSFLGELFGGNGTLGKGRNLPVMHRTLFSGSGILKSEDEMGETGMMFGMKRRLI